MAPPRQPDLFAPEEQDGLFADGETPTYRADPDDVRAELHQILVEMRAAQELPGKRLSLYGTIFPQMTLWLPDEEAAQFRFEFETELERLKAA